MDLLSGKGDLIIVMEHTDSKGRPKLRKKCTYPLTGKGCVSYVVTDLALLRWDGNRFVLDAVAPGLHAAGSDRADGDGGRRRRRTFARWSDQNNLLC